MQTKTIPSYLYTEYADDADLQAFIASYNKMAQEYIDWFNQISLPDYTNANITGGLLDWVGDGLYGFPRPVLATGQYSTNGVFNSDPLNVRGLNESSVVNNAQLYNTTDDFYKRLLTWRFYKGDGRTMNVRWLKRRVMRFILGVNGTAPPILDTNQVSVIFGINKTVTIRFYTVQNIETVGAINSQSLNTLGLNETTQTITPMSGAQNLPILISALNSGVLDLPFQYNFVLVQ